MSGAAFRKYLLPGFVFQSVVIAGGYGTGREIAEFFLTLGPRAGILAILVSTAAWSAVCAVSFEFARAFSSYEYRSFFERLLGRAGFLYEVCYLVFLTIVLAVIAAAAGSILEDTFGVSYILGVVGMMVAIGFLVFRGTRAIERFFSGWSFVLYGVYVILFVWSLSAFGDQVAEKLAADPLGPGWVVGGVRYAAYNLALIPAILFCVQHVETRKEAVSAGLLAGPIAMAPGLMFFLAMVGHFPQIVEREVPANFILETLGSRAFQITFQVVLFGTLVETGTGMIHGVNERVAAAFARHRASMPVFVRPTLAIALLLTGTLLAQFGLIALIARGYGTLTWLFLVIYVVPVLTLGVVKLGRLGRGGSRAFSGEAQEPRYPPR
jgi:uncharacterized membrane protein YkvI